MNVRYHNALLFTVAVVIFISLIFIAGLFKSEEANAKSVQHSIEVSVTSQSPLGESAGLAIPASCSANAHDASDCSVCVRTNSCGESNTGIINCADPYPSTASCVCSVSAPPEPALGCLAPTLNFSVAPNPVPNNTATDLTWDTTGGGSVTSCTAGGDWSGLKATGGGTESTGLLVSDKTYTLQCTGIGGDSPLRTLNVTVMTPPPSPTPTLSSGLSCPLGVDLSWTPTVPDTGNYHIYRCSGGGFFFSCALGSGFSYLDISFSTTYTDISVADGTRYYYRVRAHDHTFSQFSSYSNILSEIPTLIACTSPDITIKTGSGPSDPGGLIEDDVPTFSATVDNIGDEDSGPFTNVFQVAIGDVIAPFSYGAPVFASPSAGLSSSGATINFAGSGGDRDTSFTFNIGTPGTDRLVVIVAGNESGGSNPVNNLTSATVDGKACNLVTRANNPDGLGHHQEMWYCDEDDLGASSGSVTVEINPASGAPPDWGTHAHLYTGIESGGPSDFGINDTAVTTDTITVTGIDVTEGGLVVMGIGEGSGARAVSSLTAPLILRQNGPDPQSSDLFTTSGIESAAQINKSYTATLSSGFNRGVAIVATWAEILTVSSEVTNYTWDNADFGMLPIGSHTIRLCGNLDLSMAISTEDSDITNNCGDDITITVSSPPPPAGDIKADIGAGPVDGPVNILSGGSATISWSTTPVVTTSCEVYKVEPGPTRTLVGGIPAPALGDSFPTGSLTVNTVYELECFGPIGGPFVVDNVAIVIDPMADLTALIPIDPGPSVEGDTIVIQARVQNIGSAATGISFDNVFQVDEDFVNNLPPVPPLPYVYDENYLASPIVPSLADGTDSTPISFTWVNVPRGTHAVRLCADKILVGGIPVDGPIVELNELNNCGPDLVFTVDDPLPTGTLIATPPTVLSGDSTTITWDTIDATSCDVTMNALPWLTSQPPDDLVGVLTPGLIANTTFELICTGPGGANIPVDSVTVTITAAPVPTGTLTVQYNPSVSSPIPDGLPAVLNNVPRETIVNISWTTSNTLTCEVLENGSSFGTGISSPPIPSGNLVVDTLYELICDGTDGSTGNPIGSVLAELPECSNSVDDDGDTLIDHISLNPVRSDPGCSSISDDDESTVVADLTLTADGVAPTIRTTPGNTVVIDWVATDITPGSCTVTGTNGDSFIGDSGSETSIPITGPVVFTLACDDIDINPVSAEVIVNVLPSFEEF